MLIAGFSVNALTARWEFSSSLRNMTGGRLARINDEQRRLTALVLCCSLATLDGGVHTAFAVLPLLIIIAIRLFRERRRIHHALQRLEGFAASASRGVVADRLEHIVDVIEEVALRHPERMQQRHSSTGIPTREPLLARIAADGGGMIGLLRFVDFDRLSTFDPRLGHQLLVEATARLKAMLPSTRMLAHVDQAHLAIWFGAGINESSAQVEFDAILYALGEPLLVNDRPVLLDVRAHLAQLDGDDAATGLARTLAQLVVSGTEVGEPEPYVAGGSVSKKRFDLEQDLRGAVAAGELQLHYQPLIDTDLGRVCGAEALMRWNHPTQGMIAPSHFIPLLESAGLAHEIGLWAINTACREARAWRTAGLGDLRVAVNVSAHQLERENLPALIARTLERHSLPPDSLEIELTESAALVSTEAARRLFSALRELGVRIAIDDFGTGYSSLSTLRTLTFDKIKIDREFVTEVETRKESQAICQSIIALGRGLGIGILAEGVERAEEYAWLRRHGCRKFQGYFFARPLEGAAFATFAQDPQQLAAKLTNGPHTLRYGIAERMSA